MDRVIVTVRCQDSRQLYDIEMPANIPANKLAVKIKELVESVDINFTDSEYDYKINVEGLGRDLENDESLAEAGVWDGSIINLIKVS